jgi:hypothetical protein
MRVFDCSAAQKIWEPSSLVANQFYFAHSLSATLFRSFPGGICKKEREKIILNDEWQSQKCHVTLHEIDGSEEDEKNYAIAI